MRDKERKKQGLGEEDAPADSDEEDEILDEVVTIEGRKKKIMGISPPAKMIIQLWIKASRLSLQDRGNMHARDFNDE